MLNIDQYIEQVANNQMVPSYAIAVIHNGNRDVYVGGVDAVGNKVSSKTKFPISSCSKVLTALLYGYSFSDFDMKIVDIYKDFSFAEDYVTKNLTARDICTHRTGLYPNFLWGYNNQNKKNPWVVNNLSKLHQGAFRKEFIYSNYPFLVLEEMMSAHFRVNYKHLMKDNIFYKFNMTNTGFLKQGDDIGEVKTDVPPYVIYKNSLKQIPQFPLWSLCAAAGIVSNLDDMASFVYELLHMYKKRINSEFFKPNCIVQPKKIYKEFSLKFYSLCLYMEEYLGNMCIYHNGYSIGYSSLIAIMPDINFGFVALTNLDKNVLPKIAMYYALDVLLGNKDIAWEKRFVREQKISFSYKLAYEEIIENKHQDIYLDTEYYFQGHGFIAKLTSSPPKLYLNDFEYDLICLDDKTYFTYIEYINEYLIIKLDGNSLTMRGTSDIDALNFTLR